MSQPLYSDQPEICSIHQCEMDGEQCPKCEEWADDQETRLWDEVTRKESSIGTGQ